MIYYAIKDAGTDYAGLHSFASEAARDRWVAAHTVRRESITPAQILERIRGYWK
jgi:hypothetical protein